MIKVKICGMREPENILAVAKLRPDYLGFIFVPSSKRYVGADWSGVPEGVSPEIRGVAVFVNSTVQHVAETLSRYHLSVVQLHGDESPEFCRDLRIVHPGVEIWKAFRVSNREVLSKLERYQVDAFLFDSANPGSGESFDWSMLAGIRLDRPFFMAGGLGLNEVRLLRRSQIPLFGVDLNSRVESAPAVKDVQLIQRILREVEQ